MNIDMPKIETWNEDFKIYSMSPENTNDTYNDHDINHWSTLSFVSFTNLKYIN